MLQGTSNVNISIPRKVAMYNYILFWPLEMTKY